MRVEPEIGHCLLTEQHDFHIASADIANDVRIREEMQGCGGMGNRFDHRHIGADDVLQQILAVAGNGKCADFLIAGLSDLAKHFLCIFDRIAARGGIAGVKQFLPGRKDDSLGGGAAKIAANNNRAAVATRWQA